MRRFGVTVALAALFAAPASAISLFHSHWKSHYLTADANPEFVTTARKAGCYICHVKGKPKQDVQNEYGAALSQYLDADDFPKEWVKKHPEEAKRRILEAFKKVEEDLSKDRQTFGNKIAGGKLPAVDSGL